MLIYEQYASLPLILAGRCEPQPPPGPHLDELHQLVHHDHVAHTVEVTVLHEHAHVAAVTRAAHVHTLAHGRAQGNLRNLTRGGGGDRAWGRGRGRGHGPREGEEGRWGRGNMTGWEEGGVEGGREGWRGEGGGVPGEQHQFIIITTNNIRFNKFHNVITPFARHGMP